LSARVEREGGGQRDENSRENGASKKPREGHRKLLRGTVLD